MAVRSDSLWEAVAGGLSVANSGMVSVGWLTPEVIS